MCWVEPAEVFDDGTNDFWVFISLVVSNSIRVDTETGKVWQLRNFRSGVAHSPELLEPKTRGEYQYLEVEVLKYRSEYRKEYRTVRIWLHRLVYAIHHGTIPAGRQVHHRRRKNVPHINGIDNLVAVTKQEHRDLHRKLQAESSGPAMNQPMLSASDPVVVQIQQLHTSHQSPRKIEKATGVSRSTIRRILSGVYKFKD